MAITSVGYAGEVSATQWAALVTRFGSFMSVDDFASFRVSASAGVRTAVVAPGGAIAAGVYAASSAVETVSFGAVPSGTRWDLVVLRRTWGTKVTSLEVIPGGSVKALPARNTTPGTVYDQPLALVQLAAGSDAIQSVVDLRCVIQNGGVVLAWDDLVRTYLTQLGTVVRIGNTEWTRVTDAGGAPIWVSSDQTDSGWVSVPLGTGWVNGTLPWHALRVRRVGVLVSVRGLIRNSTSRASILSMAAVPNGFRPMEVTPLGVYHSSSGHFGELTVAPNGALAGVAGYYSGSLPVGNYIPIHGNWFVY